MNTTTENILHTLRARGFRITPQRLAVLQTLQDMGGHLTPLQVFQHVQERFPGVTEATIYRTLNFLTAEGIILAAHVGSGQLVYEMAHHEHHHLICRRCGHTIELQDELLQDFFTGLHVETGYKIDNRHVTLFGLCPECQGRLDKSDNGDPHVSGQRAQAHTED